MNQLPPFSYQKNDSRKPLTDKRKGGLPHFHSPFHEAADTGYFYHPGKRATKEEQIHLCQCPPRQGQDLNMIKHRCLSVLPDKKSFIFTYAPALALLLCKASAQGPFPHFAFNEAENRKAKCAFKVWAPPVTLKNQIFNPFSLLLQFCVSERITDKTHKSAQVEMCVRSQI